MKFLDLTGVSRLKEKILEVVNAHTSDVNAHITETDREKIDKVPDDIEGMINDKAPATHTHSKIQDIGDGRDLSFCYSINGLDAAWWFAAWDNNVLRAISATNVRTSIGAAPTDHGKHIPNRCEGTDDWDNATYTGYYMANNAQNAPTTGWLFGHVISHNDSYLIQELYAFTAITADKNVPKYLRVRHNGTWCSWIDVTVSKAVPSDAKFTDTVYTHPTSSGNKHIPSGGSSGQYLKWSSDGTATWSSITDNDTKNTAGSTDSSSKLYLVGATSQAANPQTYSHDTAYVGTDGHLYSNSKQAVNLSDTQALTNKTYNGYSLGDACAKAVATTVASGNTSLVTSGAVYTAINDAVGAVNTILDSI